MKDYVDCQPSLFHVEMTKTWCVDRSNGARHHFSFNWVSLAREHGGTRDKAGSFTSPIWARTSKKNITRQPFLLHPFFQLNLHGEGFANPVLANPNTSGHGVFCPFFLSPFQIWLILFFFSSVLLNSVFPLLLLHMWNMLSDPEVYMCAFRVGSLYQAPKTG